MTPIANRQTEIADPSELLSLSLLNDFLYCPRRAALKGIEGWREANEHTVRGELAHEHADLPGYEVVKGVKVLRALPVWSERLGLSGKCDIVEVHPLGVVAEVTRLTLPESPSGHQPVERRSEPPHVGSYRLVPVEYKVGKRRRFENDDAQLCAQALCLEEMLGVTVPRGAVFHAESKRRREVEFTPALRQLTETAVAGARELLDNGAVPPATFRPACEECSLFDRCLPRLTSSPAAARLAAARLFTVPEG